MLDAFFPGQNCYIYIAGCRWYGEPATDGDWKHWNHEVLPHWTRHVNEKYPSIGSYFTPPQNIHSPFYPLLYPYSSSDKTVIKKHLEWMKDAHIEVVVMSWWGQCSNPNSMDTQGICTDNVAPIVFEVADEVGGIYIAFHLEPYKGRSVESIRDDLAYIHRAYGHHSSLYRYPRDESVTTGPNVETSTRGLPLFYVYDSYHIATANWHRLLSSEGDLSIRGQESLDGVFIGLWLERQHGADLYDGGFDGIYSYFASDGTSYGSRSQNWPSMCSFCHSKPNPRTINGRMICDISVGPGYNDAKIRPWNRDSIRKRDAGSSGSYYEEKWGRALEVQPEVSNCVRWDKL